MTLGKKYLLLAMGMLVLIVGMCGYTYLNTPGFSAPSGFYDAEFDLEIKFGPGYECFYTLDGSEPTRDSTPYTGPIPISDASLNPNRYANIREVSPAAFPEVLAPFGQDAVNCSPPVYVPDYLLDKCTVVRAAIYHEETLVSTLSGSYFVGFQDKPLYDNVTVVSLTTDPDNLFGYENGIYVTGKAFDDFVSNEVPQNIDVSTWPANYRIIGRESERPAHIEVWDENGDRVLSQNCGIRIQGNYSRLFSIKNLSIYARTEYSGSDVFPSELFGTGVQPHKFILFGGSADMFDKLRDYLGHRLFSDMKFATYSMKPCVLFLDGEFWGTYYLTEAFKASYVSDHYGVPEDDVILHRSKSPDKKTVDTEILAQVIARFYKEHELPLEYSADLESVELVMPYWLMRDCVAGITEGDVYDALPLMDMLYYICSHDMSDPEYYNRTKELIDIDSYIDYYATQIYINNQDWPLCNTAQWRTRGTQGSSPYQDGRWRPMLYDLNLFRDGIYTCFANNDVDMIEWTISKDIIFGSLCKNPEFAAKFVERLRYIAYELCVPESYEPILSEYLSTMSDLLAADNMRFYGVKNEESRLYSVESIRSFFETRSEHIEKWIVCHFPEYA